MPRGTSVTAGITTRTGTSSVVPERRTTRLRIAASPWIARAASSTCATAGWIRRTADSSPSTSGLGPTCAQPATHTPTLQTIPLTSWTRSGVISSQRRWWRTRRLGHSRPPCVLKDLILRIHISLRVRARTARGEPSMVRSTSRTRCSTASARSRTAPVGRFSAFTTTCDQHLSASSSSSKTCPRDHEA